MHCRFSVSISLWANIIMYFCVTCIVECRVENHDGRGTFLGRSWIAALEFRIHFSPPSTIGNRHFSHSIILCIRTNKKSQTNSTHDWLIWWFKEQNANVMRVTAVTLLCPNFTRVILLAFHSFLFRVCGCRARAHVLFFFFSNVYGTYYVVYGVQRVCHE